MQTSCAYHAPLFTVKALRARGKRAVALPHAAGLPEIVAGWTWCATSTASAAAVSTAPKPMHSPANRRLRQALRRQRCTAQPPFARPAWPRRALRSNDYQCAPRKLNVPPTILPRRYASAASVQSPYLTFGLPAIVAGLTWFATSMASAAAASNATKTMHSPAHRRLRQAQRI
jgi:hypothetical protein